MINQKKSQGHVEIMLSFILFAGVLIFIFIYANPILKSKEKGYVIENVQKIILNEISSDLGTLSVIVASENDCYEVPEEYPADFIEIHDEKNPRKYTLYFSSYFRRGTISCSSEPSRSYTLGVYSEERIIRYEKIKELKKNYEEDYNSLKNLLGINNDFSFNFKDMESDLISDLSVYKETPYGTRIESREFPVRIIDNSGKIYELIFNIKAW